MSRRTLRAGLAGGLAAGLALLGVAAHADPNPNPDVGTPIAGKAPLDLYAGVGADAFAELSNNFVSQYNGQSPAPTRLLESYDAVNPVTGATGVGENISTKPGCSGIPRPNGANAGINAIALNQKSTVDPTAFCIDWVRSSRLKGSAATDAALTFYAQSRDAVGYAVIGNAYAPTTPLTTAQVRGIFQCTITDWSEVGGQAGPIHVYRPPTSAATYTFFLTAIGSSLTAVQAGCGTPGTVANAQQNDGTTMNGDPLGIAPYTVTKWAAQSNADLGANAVTGIVDNRGGTHVGFVNTTTAPTTDTLFNGVTYQVLNPAYADNAGPSASFGRLFFNVTRNDAPADLQAIFGPTGFVCTHADELLIPYGNTPLGSDTTQSNFCGQAS